MDKWVPSNLYIINKTMCHSTYKTTLIVFVYTIYIYIYSTWLMSIVTHKKLLILYFVYGTLFNIYIKYYNKPYYMNAQLYT